MSRKRGRMHDNGDSARDGSYSPDMSVNQSKKSRAESRENISKTHSDRQVPVGRGSEVDDDAFDSSNIFHFSVKQEATNGRYVHSQTEENSEEGSQDELGDQDNEDEDGSQRVAIMERELSSICSNELAVAEAGVITKVELINFMCHKRLTVPLGPQTNFIIGHNGSGKSAILTGILIALGGKAATTNRGSSLKSLVKEGESRAEVRLHFRNCGLEAFKPEKYGPSILVEKVINADGGGQWRIRNAEGKIVSSRRDELNAFCDHTNIQVDNPMNVLTQDAARQFLSASNPSDMYDFFLRGTQLKQLSDEYEIINTNIQRIKRTVESKEDALPELEEAARKAAGRYSLIEKQKSHHQKLQHLKDQVVWAQVLSRQRDYESAVNLMERSRVKQDKLQKEIERLSAALTDHNERITEIENRSRNDGDRVAPYVEERSRLKVEMRELRTELTKAKEDEAEQSMQYSRLIRTADELSKRIEHETSKLAEGNRLKHMELERRHVELETQRRWLAEQEAFQREALRDADPRAQRLAQQEAQTADERQRMRNRLEEQEALCNRLVEASRNSVAAYGAAVPALVRAIEQEDRWQRKPVGPIGLHLKLKDSKWAPVLESVIGNTLNAFCVTNHLDRRLLEAIKRRVNCEQVPIVTGSDEPLDFSQGEPPPDVLTILRVLDIDNSFVLHQLINAVHIESAAIVERRSEGDQLMRRNVRNVKTCCSQDMFLIRGGAIGSTTQTLNPYTGPPRLSTDVSGRLDEAKRTVSQAQDELRRLNEEMKALSREKVEVQNVFKRSRERLRLTQQRQLRTRDELAQLEEDMRADEPANMAALEEARKEAREELDKCRETFSAVQARKEAGELKMRPKQDRYEELRNLIENVEEQVGAIRHELQKAVEQRVQCSQELKLRKASLEKVNRELADQEEHAKIKRIDFESAEGQALEYTDNRRVEATRSHDHYEREIEAVEKIIEEARRQGGGSLDQVLAEFKARQKAFEEAKSEMDDMKFTIKSLLAALKRRLSWWQMTRRMIAVRARHNFAFQLSIRGYSGSLSFSHDAQKLTIQVQTDDSNAIRDGGSRSKDPRSLSGGEKSFSTVCLLLSLWEAIGCPLRCLDEFDVFMDAINRRIAMKMITDTAKTSHNVQYILITPQNMGNIRLGPEVHVQKLSDPERGQGVLGFGQ